MGAVWITFLFIPEPLQPSFLKQKMMRWGWGTREIHGDAEIRKERQRRPKKRQGNKEKNKREGKPVQERAPPPGSSSAGTCAPEKDYYLKAGFARSSQQDDSAGQRKASVTKPGDSSSVPRTTLWKERPDCYPQVVL